MVAVKGLSVVRQNNTINTYEDGSFVEKKEYIINDFLISKYEVTEELCNAIIEYFEEKT